ncbi:uncharacterized protein BDR25DRAFT_351200 [Lindgomyces ingoldianus]|uniref:Uncharacterized protein n=1 Tax=Lindgomyces ingoldianus TaxID=673940 RepID=A0ACB6R5U0_9PLEO|nr:uncharacterized protein BDR25DRAFT_351200 [Lindgomyces ingoldianus]KAF2474679.1 hypothetical protein BDR25DRAFT_351200 [Lindgomyces ingoldianus]
MVVAILAIPLRQGRNHDRAFEELGNPVSWVIFRLSELVISPVTVSLSHADLSGDDIHDVVQIPIGGDARDHTVDQVFGILLSLSYRTIVIEYRAQLEFRWVSSDWIGLKVVLIYEESRSLCFGQTNTREAQKGPGDEAEEVWIFPGLGAKKVNSRYEKFGSCIAYFYLTSCLLVFETNYAIKELENCEDILADQDPGRSAPLVIEKNFIKSDSSRQLFPFESRAWYPRLSLPLSPLPLDPALQHPTTMARKRERSPSPSLEIFRSESIEDQKSVFIAAFSNSVPVKALQALPEFKSATHRIAAWRKPSRQRSLMGKSEILYDLGHDDDGEQKAGKRLEHVLNYCEVEGAVVVARWYGGQNIGPIRFVHIENCAKEAIWRWKVVDAEAKNEQTAKKQRLEAEAAKKDEETARRELAENLNERDQNIFVLRGLLADKTAKLNNSERVPPTPQKKPPDYNTMSMELLKRHDKARDASIAYILKEIDKVDEQLQLIDDFEASTPDF